MPFFRRTTDDTSSGGEEGGTHHHSADFATVYDHTTTLKDNAPSAASLAAVPQPFDADNNEDLPLSFAQRRAVACANRPWTHFCTSLLVSLLLGVGGLILGNFSISVEADGWESRGTLIAERHMQFLIVDYNADVLYNDVSGVHWQELIDNKQENYYENDDDDDDEEEEGQDRRLHDVVQVNASPRPFFDDALRLYHSKSTDDKEGRRPPFAWSATLDRRLQQVSNTGVLEGCDTTLYTSGRLFDEERLWPIWRLTAPAAPGSFFQAHVFEELCEQEALTQQYLAENNLCFGCDSDQKCLPPYSLVLYARLVVENGMTMDCQELAQNWEAYEMEGQDELVECVVDLKADYNPERDGQDFPASCPQGFSPMMLDELYDETNRIQFTSSVFATTYDDIDELYDAVDNYARGEEHVSGAYDTQDEDFVNLSLDAQLGVDMSLALASAFVTTIAMIVHTRSLFLALTGLLQVTLSFPLAFGAYRFMGSIEFFPFLNFIGVFVLFALGADDVFVAVDKWKNARLRKPSASVQEIAKIAFPDAAMAMLLTTATTSVAFFGTAICPVAPIRCFAIFVGIMIILDYMLCILLVFPALVIYDNRRDKPSCWSRCCSCFSCCGPKEFSDEDIDEAVQPSSKQSLPNDAVEEIDEEANLIRRIFGRYYTVLHAIRWPLLVACIVAFVLTAIKAASLDLPTSSDVRLYNENDNQYEQNFVWRQNLLYDALYKKGGSTAYVVWGLTPADNGDRNDPTEWSSLVLDDSFEASDTDSQAFLRDFCDKFFSNVFAGLVDSDYVCPINRFDEWLQEQSISTAPDSVYQDFCGGASSLPMDPSTFDACISGWADMENETTVLSRQGKVEVMYIKFNSRVRYDSPYEDLDDEWHAIEDYMDSLDAPPTALNGYFTSEDFWWYDTNGSMLETAYSSSAIAMGAAAGAILLSSRSIVLTFFSTLTVGYVLTSVTATLVAMGWTLGFLEAILFAILIGISCDFVIHLTHAYAHAMGECDRGTRTKYALLSMGPSILAAAITTFCAATVMLFTVIIFFQKFAVVLFMTVLQATAGSFIVFAVMTDTIGPKNPTYLYDSMVAKWTQWRRGEAA